MTGAYAVPEIAANLQLALTLQPQTRQVVLVGGTSGSDRVYQSWVRAVHKKLCYLSSAKMIDRQEENLPD
jgi:hypothetical protein